MKLKRCLDFGVSLVALILLAPLLIAIAICVLVLIGRPIVFTHQRPGYKGRPFQMFKFRTMTNEYLADGRPLPDSARLTHFGRILRSTSLDELPELWNVLRGEMSLIGPRPLLLEYLPLYTAMQLRRHDVRPGITGWAQVNGRNNLSWEERFTLDVWYVDNQSFWLDIKIVILTVWKVLKRDGITAAGEATMPKFAGSKETDGL